MLHQLSEPVAILPLFLADGLLLDPARTLAASHGWTLVEPLGCELPRLCWSATGPRCSWPSASRHE